MKRWILAILVVGALGMLLFPTAAAQFEDISPFVDDHDPVSEIDTVTMAPSEGPNGVYATLNEDDEIELNISEENQNLAGKGVNENAITEIDDIFVINYTGDTLAHVWLTVGDDTGEIDTENIEFYRSGDGSSIQGEENNATLHVDDRELSVGLEIDTTDSDHDVEEIDTFTVHAQIPDEISVSVETRDATGIGQNSATLHGEIEGDTEPDVYFEYREAGADSWERTEPRGLGSSDEFIQSVEGLDPGTEYEYRAIAETTTASDTGDTKSFTTAQQNVEEAPDPSPDDPQEPPPTDGTPTPEEPTPEGTPQEDTPTPTPTETPTPTPTETPTPDDEAISPPDTTTPVTGESPDEGGVGEALGGVLANTLLLLLVALLLGLGTFLLIRHAMESDVTPGGANA